MAPPALRRVAIFGAPGSGKSTLARALAARLDLPAIHIDRFYFHPGWEPRSRDELAALVAQAAAGEAWIFDGNNSSTFPLRSARADLLVFLDLPRSLRLWRLSLRIAGGYGRVRPDSAPGCPERLDLQFLRWAWNWNRDIRPKMLALAEAPGAPPLLRLTSPRAVQTWLDSLPLATPAFAP